VIKLREDYGNFSIFLFTSSFLVPNILNTLFWVTHLLIKMLSKS